MTIDLIDQIAWEKTCIKHCLALRITYILLGIRTLGLLHSLLAWTSPAIVSSRPIHSISIPSPRMKTLAYLTVSFCALSCLATDLLTPENVAAGIETVE
jgi:hypothetical protein